MLKRNIYFLYPAGYYGTYVNWAISASDVDMRENTVANPLNTSKSKEMGGSGTSHLHVKIPAHHSPPVHYSWAMRNTDKSPRIYSINLSTNLTLPGMDTYSFIGIILASDPDAMFVNLHSDRNVDLKRFCSINSLLKWPTQYVAMQSNNHYYKQKFDPFNCSNDIMFRNLVVLNEDGVLRYNDPLDRSLVDQGVKLYSNWFKARNLLQPHEVNSTTYADPSLYMSKYQNSVYDLNCLDIIGDQFDSVLTDLLLQSNAVSEFDTAPIKLIHQDFIKSQENLQWFTAINKWRATQELDDYITGHSLMQAFVIREMFDTKPAFSASLDWKTLPINDINSKYKEF
jgi:hypothetical protein